MNTSILTSLNDNSERVKEIIRVLSKNGLIDWLNNSNIEWIKDHLQKGKHSSVANETKEKRVRLALNELGTTFIKLGQLLSTRPDLVGNDMALELTKLQSKTKPDSISYVRTVIKNELGINSVDEVFSDFGTNPIASASIGQVHLAKLITGEEVVVKIIHKGIEEVVEKDMKIMLALAHLAENYSKQLKPYQPIKLVSGFSKTLFNEFDFKKELSNIEQFDRNFSDNKLLVMPKVFPKYSGRRVLTMEKIEGKSITELTDGDFTDEEKSSIVFNGAKAFMDMVFIYNFYHSDPHPGNFFIQSNGSVALIDFGMVGRLNADNLEKIENIIIGVVEKDNEQIKNAIMELGTVPIYCDQDLLTTQIEDFIEDHLYLSLKEFDMSKAINQSIEIIQLHHIILPANISLLLRVLAMFEGTARMLAPAFNLTDLFQDYYPKIVMKRFSPEVLLKKMTKNIRHWERVVDITPKVLLKSLKNAQKGNFKINMEHHNLETPINNLVKGLLSSALFLGSSMIVSSRIPPLVGEFSIVGLLGMVVSIFLGYRFLLKNKKKENQDNE